MWRQSKHSCLLSIPERVSPSILPRYGLGWLALNLAPKSNEFFESAPAGSDLAFATGMRVYLRGRYSYCPLYKPKL